MPHQCTSCGRTFPDGSKEMLSGCPTCGSNKFQFRPKGSADEPAEPASDAAPGPDEPRSDPAATGTDPAGAPRSAAGTDADPTPTDADPKPTGSPPVDGNPDLDEEDGAQAAARSEMVDRSELPDAGESADPSRDPAAAGQSADAPADADGDADPNLAALREKLNDQFESIRILSPGQYELNLMELYDRDEYIISLREDGRYVIEMPETWGPEE
ncbi:OapC/ArvC family zinc-ribbon domain-containing protein [Halorarum salinum]|uniref:Zn-ribbon containing protein n=1 Tax=Halorarum salinum TaxID=2743089 RepID=A0A7D5QIR9_9EURY|nr:Zn-ribbon containing protein [Halobaculum salinum]QLG60905.1 hypothetical protein HUG12_03765 [Halobaculum salinum]